MSKAIRFHSAGGPEVMRLERTDVAAPSPGEVRIRHVAAGINFADIYLRNGTRSARLPSGIGVEAAGVIQDVGRGVTGFAPGDRVTYIGSADALGAYSTERVIAADALIHLPDRIGFETAAATTLRGLACACLMRRIYPFQAGETILVHAVAGGLGHILVQWAKLLGLRVIGTVSKPEKAEFARESGCDHVMDYSQEDVAARVRDITDGAGVSVVIDSVGRSTFMASLDSLKRHGLMVCVGASSGALPPVDPQLLAQKGSLYLTRPMLADYITDPTDKAALVDELFGHVAEGRIRIGIDRHYAIEDAAQAHRDLEARRTIGSSIFVL